MKKRKAPKTPTTAGKKSKKGGGASAKKGGDAVSERWRPMPVRLHFGAAFSRHIFLRAPSKGADGAEEGTALFVAAVPPGWSKSTLSEFMSRFGRSGRVARDARQRAGRRRRARQVRGW